MTKIGFLSFGHYADVPGSRVASAAEMLRQSIDLAVAAEEAGLDGAYFRVHHFARQAASPIPLLAAVAARTSRIEMGTGVIDLRYEVPAMLAEQASAVDLIAGGRLQLGVSRGSPEPALRGWEAFGQYPQGFEDAAGMARRKAVELAGMLSGAGVATADPEQAHDRAVLVPEEGLLRVEPRSEGLRRRIWWGAGSASTARWAAEQGFNLQSSTLLLDDDGRDFGDLQAAQIDEYRTAWHEAGWGWTPRVSVSRSIIPIVDDESDRYFGLRAQAEGRDQVGVLEGVRSRFGRSYIGEPDRLAEQLRDDAAVQAADTVLVTVPNMLGVDFNARLFESLHRDLRPALG